jgi:hypothetical protein
MGAILSMSNQAQATRKFSVTLLFLKNLLMLYSVKIQAINRIGLSAVSP